LQIEGADSDESWKPCHTVEDCGKSVWLDTREGFMLDTILEYRRHSSAITIPN
jgi:hypothetical protein